MHPDWLAVGSSVEVSRRQGHSKMPPRTATVVRQTPTLVILDSGERFKADPWSVGLYVLTPPYLDYRTLLQRPLR